VIIGSFELLLDIFRSSIYWILYFVVTSSPVSNTINLEYLDKYIFIIIDIVDDNILFIILLEDICYTFYYNLRDRVYGILCIFSANINLGIIPDYSKTKEKVYKDFVQRYIKNS
jgi:hypothetical protein